MRRIILTVRTTAVLARDPCMISLFTIPRSFTGDTGIRQRNAIGTWIRAIPAVDVMLLGDDPGVADVAAELGVRHVPQVRRNGYGTPLLDSAFALAAAAAKHDRLGYINTDILLTREFAAALPRVSFEKCLTIGQRTDIDLTELLDFDDLWEQRITAQARKQGKLSQPYGCDYFVFQRNSPLVELPPFAVGRPRWDNWLIARALQLSMPVVDITPVCLAVHQNHGYDHVPAARGRSWMGPEGDANTDLAGSMFASVLDATHRLTHRGIVRNGRARREALRVWWALDKRATMLKDWARSR